jgi:steroid delta-isomerase-like uncharacterized protein
MAQPKTPITDQRIREITQLAYQAWNNHDADAIADLLTDDVVWTDPGLPEQLRGKEAVVTYLKDVFKAFPDMHFPAEDFMAFPDASKGMDLTKWTMTATMKESLDIGLPATGKSVRTSGVVFSRYRGDKICEYTNYYDSLDFLQQLGLLPKSDGLPFKALVMADVLAGAVIDRASKVLHR